MPHLLDSRAGAIEARGGWGVACFYPYGGFPLCAVIFHIWSIVVVLPMSDGLCVAQRIMQIFFACMHVGDVAHYLQVEDDVTCLVNALLAIVGGGG